MHQLQVELRMYIKQDKERSRMEKLNKWKEEFKLEATISPGIPIRQTLKDRFEFKPNKTERRTHH